MLNSTTLGVFALLCSIGWIYQAHLSALGLVLAQFIFSLSPLDLSNKLSVEAYSNYGMFVVLVIASIFIHLIVTSRYLARNQFAMKRAAGQLIRDPKDMRRGFARILVSLAVYGGLLCFVIYQSIVKDQSPIFHSAFRFSAIALVAYIAGGFMVDHLKYVVLAKSISKLK